MRYDARTENWMPMEIRGGSGYFNDMRIDKDTVPDWFSFWELADEDGNGEPCRYRHGILVNFYGTFITTGELPLNDPGCGVGYIDPERGYAFTGERYIPFADVVQMEMEKLAV